MKMTQEQLAELISKVFTNLGEKRKARKEAGEDVSTDFSVDEIIAEVSDIIGDTGENNENPEGEDIGESDIKSDGVGVSPELIAKVIAALGIVEGEEPTTEIKDEKAAGDSKSTEQDMKTKAAKPTAPQRKYVNLFLTNNSATKANDFKSRLDGMSAPERKKTAYGMFGRAVKCIHSSKGDFEKAAYTAEHKFNDSEMAREFKALSTIVPSDGGYLVPEVYANEIIEMLYPTTVIYSLGARRLGMSNGNLNIPKLKTGTRALFTGENRSIPKSAPKFGNLRLSAKKLTALIPMSNDLLRSTNFDNDVIVGQDITKQMALGVDYGALLGTGGEFQPLGIIKNKNVQNIDVTTLDAAYSSATGVLTAAFPNYLVASVLKNNVYADGLGFVFNTSVEQFLKAMRDDIGAFIFAKEMNENHTLVGYPYQSTNLLETANGKTSIIFGNWNDLIIGEQGALEIVTSTEGSWTDESGQLVSAFENDQTLIRAIDNVDIGLRHDESFAVATKVAVPV